MNKWWPLRPFESSPACVPILNSWRIHDLGRDFEVGGWSKRRREMEGVSGRPRSPAPRFWSSLPSPSSPPSSSRLLSSLPLPPDNTCQPASFCPIIWPTEPGSTMLRPPPLHRVPSVSGVSVAGGEYSARAGDYSRDLSLPLCRIPNRDDISLGGSIYPSPTSAAGVGVHFSVISGEKPTLALRCTLNTGSKQVARLAAPPCPGTLRTHCTWRHWWC